ncbi:MAG: DUF2796 domain-containing protein [Pseudomonas sp.]
MRRLLLALPFALLPLAIAQAHEHEHEHEGHASLGAHEHGVALLNVALVGQALELEWASPAMNLVGFEHAAESVADKAKVGAVRAELEQPLSLFGIPSAAGCQVAQQELESPLFGDAHGHGETDQAHDEHESAHSEIHAHYQLSCKQPAVLPGLNLGELFKRFPATQKIRVQLLGPNGQRGLEATSKNAILSF